MVPVDLDDLAAPAAGDLAQLALLVGRGLLDGADAKVDNRLAYGSAFQFETTHVLVEEPSTASKPDNAPPYRITVTVQ